MTKSQADKRVVLAPDEPTAYPQRVYRFELGIVLERRDQLPDYWSAQAFITEPEARHLAKWLKEQGFLDD